MIFDAHGDILTDIYEETLKGNKQSFITKHYPFYLKSGIKQSIFVNWTDPNTKSKTYFDDVFDVSIKELKNHADILSICHNLNELEKANDEHKLGVILGIEGLKYLEKPEDIFSLYKKGIRHAILTWNEENKYAGGVSFPDVGLSELGHKLISLMQEYKMIIDLSHANEKTFKDIMDVVKGPLIVSHGNAKALCDHARNYTDEQLDMVKEHDGVIGVCAVASFISKEKENQTVSYLAKHIDYIVNRIGIDHVGLGLDVCYYLYEGKNSTGVTGLETIAEASNLLVELKKLGYSDEDINKIAYQNFQRVVKAVL